MLSLLNPNLFVENITQISIDDLIRKGIRGIIFDLDNTLTEWKQNNIHPEVEAWIAEIKKKNFKVCLVSNNKSGRVSKIAGLMGAPSIPKAKKPMRSAFFQALEILGTTRETTAVIGDQIFTDVLGGNRLGMYTILVVPLSKREFIWTRFMRCLEILVLKYFLDRRK